MAVFCFHFFVSECLLYRQHLLFANQSLLFPIATIHPCHSLLSFFFLFAVICQYITNQTQNPFLLPNVLYSQNVRCSSNFSDLLAVYSCQELNWTKLLVPPFFFFSFACLLDYFFILASSQSKDVLYNCYHQSKSF